MAREYHTQKRRNKEMKDKDRPWMFCPCRVAGWVVEVYFNAKFVLEGVLDLFQDIPRILITV